MPTATPALRRVRASTARLFGRFGFVAEFQRYSATPDWTDGSTEYAAVGDPIPARCRFDEQRFERASGDSGSGTVWVPERVLLVEPEPFAPDGLTDEYRATIDGAERRFQSAVLDPDGTHYVLRFSDFGK